MYDHFDICPVISECFRWVGTADRRTDGRPWYCYSSIVLCVDFQVNIHQKLSQHTYRLVTTSDVLSAVIAAELLLLCR